MTVKQEIIDNAVWAIKRLMNCSLPAAKAKAVYMLYKELNEHYKFAVEEKKKIVAVLGGTVTHDGGVEFKENREECAKKFIKKVNDIEMLDVEIVAKPLHISIADVEGARLRPMDIIILEPFIVFE